MNYWIIAAVVVAVAALLSSPIRCRLTIVREAQDDDITFDVHGLYGMVKKRIAVPFIQFKNFVEGVNVETAYIDKKEHQLVSVKDEKITKRSIKESFDNALELLGNCFHFHEWLTATLTHVRCIQFDWKTTVGVGDAPETAVATGMIWGLKSTMLGFLSRFIKLDARPKLQVIPQYNQTKFSTEVLVKLQISMWFILIAGIRLLARILKVKGGLKTWRRVLFKA
ncbi:Protein of unknown function [Paenibacillus sp. 1_12]|uniref:DUF2953 domain-containing protein n=1 Tax=Paenibacillus sp. 1_12 TaxID=1566278 RepID=UPI0008ED5DB7|nr:DUF2953 domain-containing protein [Paenibacillus sp. 1_12]SFK92660.1 Protein of unknown function [Paenibacillus sp. 1_12]